MHATFDKVFSPRAQYPALSRRSPACRGRSRAEQRNRQQPDRRSDRCHRGAERVAGDRRAAPARPDERSLGTFKTTGYSNPNGTRCADGSVPKAAHTVASDWGVLPRGSKIRFAGSDTIYTVEDNGVRGQIVDVYYATTAEAWAHGVQYREVYLILE